MRLMKPRIAPASDDELTVEQRATMALMGGRAHNLFRTLIRAPDATAGFFAWAGYVMSRQNGLEARDREIIILRTGFLCKSGYEWTQHHDIALNCGLAPDEIERIKAGAEAVGWTAAEGALISAADELHAGQFISDPTWVILSKHFSEKQCMDVVFTIGQYTQVSMLLNTFGVQLDEGLTLDPDLKG